MKIAFVMRTPFFLKNFTAGLQELQARSHDLHVLFSEPLAGRVGEDMMGESGQMLPGVSMTAMPPPSSGRSGLAVLLATLLDVMRYDHSIYDNAPKLRQRAYRKSASNPLVSPLLALTRKRSKLVGEATVEAFLRNCLDHVPAPALMVNWLRQHRIDLLLVSPLTPIGSEQVNWVLAARAARIPIVYCMYSWDNLSNKGLLRPYPDAALVWNQTHCQEAVTMHGMPLEAIYCTGSPGYDIWFEPHQGTDRKEFCHKVGLDPDHPFLLYTCSSVFVGGKQELPFVESWLLALRSHTNPKVAGVGVLIRPHPQFSGIWNTADFTKFGNVAVYPRSGAIPFSGNARSDYQDSIRHSLAVVGINTSAMVEAAIIDRPVITIDDPSYTDTQIGTLHFQHLQKYQFLIRSESIKASFEKIGRLIANDPELIRLSHEGNRRFVKDYIRPRGIGQSAAIFWADAIETVGNNHNLRQPEKNWRFALLIQAGLPVFWFIDLLNHVLKPKVSKPEKVKTPKPVKKENLTFLSKAKGDEPVTTELPGGKDVPCRELSDQKFAKLNVNNFEIEKKSNYPKQENLAGQLKLKVKDWLINEPPRVKDVARLEGPYPILKSLVKAYDGPDSVPGLLVLGDSVHYRVSREDRDRRALSDMLIDEFDSSGMRALCLNYSAYHPGVYAALIRAVGRMRYHPQRVILPINLRCFSPQWYLHPDHIFAEEIHILDEYRPGSAIPEIVRPDNRAAIEDYDASAVYYADSPLNTIGQFRLVANAKSRSQYQEVWHARQLAIFHYLYSMNDTHPHLLNAIAMVRAAVAVGIRPLIYLTPINHAHGMRVVGCAFERGVALNVERIKSSLLPEMVSAESDFHDWSRDFPDTMFFHPGERTEHLNEWGRKELALRIEKALKALP